LSAEVRNLGGGLSTAIEVIQRLRESLRKLSARVEALERRAALKPAKPKLRRRAG
jgi:hypothetical protein